ncbi:monovalent cation/H(+) antiporter subunit G [Stieleria varia]|uniref:Na(+)/H(+) antiporter subunit G n=1 Tax=Stieleria varia TaxID=2528005 RepID=A0A5C6B4B5_9BACT|nr:monovalent cation/H(+) antiporter subunit G [Stieleria varia]TWU06159.1 Na(+)/H(+) antiporter subunit G [Stieleria varia]
MTFAELMIEVGRWATVGIAVVMILIGLFFLFVAAVGVLRLPDVFTRSHAVSLTDSLGALFLLGGLAIYQGFTTNSVKILVVLMLLYLLNPVIAHATVRSAFRCGLRPGSSDDDDVLV